MFCQFCGKRIPNDSLFCPECGKKLDEKIENDEKANSTEGAYADIYSNNQTKQLSAEEIEKNKKKSKAIGVIAALLTVGGVAAAVVSLAVKPTIKLDKYVIISADGYDTVGKAEVEFNREKFSQDYGKKIAKSYGKKVSKEDGYESLSEKFLDNIVSGKLDKEDMLSNGDVITYKWKCSDEKALSKYGVKLKYSDIEYTVNGLEEAELFDPFDGMKITFLGIEPYGEIEIAGNPSAKEAANFRFEADKKYNLSNGETVTLNAYIGYGSDPIEYCVEQYGMIPASLTKEYVVEGLDKYVGAIAEISEECLTGMQNQAMEVYKSREVNTMRDDESLVAFDYIGNYLLTNKNSDGWGDQNILYLIYKVTVNNTVKEKYNKDNEFYWYISFDDLLVSNQEGTTVELTDYRVPSNRVYIDSGVKSGWFGTKQWYYSGYESLEQLYSEIGQYYFDTYNHEDNVNEEYAVSGEIPADSSDDEIIFENSSKELIDADKVKALTDEELRLAINEIYARKGYIFNDEELLSHFRQFDWYEEEVKSDQFAMSMFNEVEQKNVEMMQEERSRR